MADLQKIKDIATIVGVVLSPVIGALTAIWTYRRKEREVLHGYIEWSFTPTMQGEEERPFLVVHNRSDRPVMIRAVRYLKGAVIRRREFGTAMDYEDPTDLRFPYEVEPGKISRFILDEHAAARLADEARKVDLLLSRAIGRPRIWVEAVSMAGTKLRVSGEQAITWKRRPTWFQP